MKPWPLVLGIVVILVVFCSPGLAITKSDILTRYKTGTWPLTPIPTQSGIGTSTGTLSVTSTPTGATVYLDGMDKGITPVTITGVSSGLHKLTVTLSGYQDYSTWVRITVGKTATVHATLKVKGGPTTVPATTATPTPTSGTGTLSVTSTPTWATVYLDGMERGITPVTITGLSPGLHKLTVDAPIFYEDYSTWVWIRTGETATVHVTLKDHSIPITDPTKVPTIIPTPTPSFRGTGTLSVTSDPAGATVYLDGKERGITPVTITALSTGLHQLTVTLSGYEYYSTRIIILTRKTATVHAALKDQSIPDYNWSDDTPVKKPNIYLYSDRDLTAQVQLAPERAITVSEPAYKPGMGWRAEVRNGSLNGKGDFLFYEAVVPDSGWQNKEGYVIRAAYREQDMTFMLGQYGFNKKETVDFVHYWVSHLPGDVDYVFYPQETGAVESVMPLIISPQPDDVMRIWFYAEPLVSAPEPMTSPEKIVREGFYVVEWGVMVRDE